MSELDQLPLNLSVDPSPKAETHGGRRRGSARRRAPGKRRAVPHRTRATHLGRHPVHVTMRALRSLPSLRSERIRNLLLRAIFAQAKRLGNFRVVHFSIQRDHIHLLLEAGVPAPTPQLVLPLAGLRVSAHDGPAVDELPPSDPARTPETLLRSGMIGLATSLARRLNRMLGRRGKVWDGRHHRRDLESPTSVRRALVYVLQNHVHHGLARAGLLDRFSTALEFPVWIAASGVPEEATEGGRRSVLGPPGRTPRSWLLATGWLRAGGLLRRDEVPS